MRNASRSSVWPMHPTCQAEPQAMSWICSTLLRYSSVMCLSSNSTFPPRMRGESVSRNALGCSIISLIMKCSYPPFSAEATSHVMVSLSRATGSPCLS